MQWGCKPRSFVVIMDATSGGEISAFQSCTNAQTSFTYASMSHGTPHDFE